MACRNFSSFQSRFKVGNSLKISSGKKDSFIHFHPFHCLLNKSLFDRLPILNGFAPADV
jgi:hypothetical protein